MNKVVVVSMGLWAVISGAALGCGASKETPADGPAVAATGESHGGAPTPAGDSALLTPDQCVAQGGETIGDRGDGSSRKNGCADGRRLLGNVKIGIEGGICCAR
jgi:hypothetical protein